MSSFSISSTIQSSALQAARHGTVRHGTSKSAPFRMHRLIMARSTRSMMMRSTTSTYSDVSIFTTIFFFLLFTLKLTLFCHEQQSLTHFAFFVSFVICAGGRNSERQFLGPQRSAPYAQLALRAAAKHSPAVIRYADQRHARDRLRLWRVSI